ncbi:HAD-IC family P-type ATPase [Streptococcus sciuri]|uniref:HAD-IC family P-type ATPase n=1 Tax=Streptococcus sciuri TaxID=2973939 RepID=A0ABT2F6U3_9STRE|nr:HAD-IC family P-type ATPase [Streptococcus sciuri]MCS4488196.1 HAD-IC family P-type ATPase [Streptococcus sciuri]
MKNSWSKEGLSTAEVEVQKAAGHINQMSKQRQNTYWLIIKRNVFTLFNLLNLFIVIALLAVKAWSETIFFSVIIINAFSGILVEIRAKRMIDRLNLISQDQVTVIRNAQTEKLSPKQLVLGDLIVLSTGDQVPSDAKVVSGFAELNEAMLTGESDLVPKTVDNEILAGSFLISGHIQAIVQKVGDDNYASKLMIEAKKDKSGGSRIIQSLDRVASFTGKIIIPFGIGLLLEALYLRYLPTKIAVIYTSTPLLGMLPKGIALLTITALLTAVIKLGRKRVLVQEMYSVETLAHVDTLCLDKTGTITEGKMRLERVTPLNDTSLELFEDYLSTYITASEDNNPTARAIRQVYGKDTKYNNIISSIPFSSQRKWGAISFANIGSLYLGAPDLLINTHPKALLEAQEQGARTLVLCLSQKPLQTKSKSPASDLVPLGLLMISDPIRKGVTSTLDYLKSQDVDLRIISGDNPITVSNIAKKAGFDNYQSYIDCSTLSETDLSAKIPETTIFGRVSPEQKRQIIRELKEQEHTVAMTGDGVNDILALREADCSIAMAEGDPATRQVANLVLLDSDFNDVPEILFEGRRVVNNIARVAPIFLVKTVYSFTLALLCLISPLFSDVLIFPFTPLQVTIVDQFMEGLPPFLLSFEKNNKLVEKDFLQLSVLKAIPSGLLITVGLLFSRIAGHYGSWSLPEQSALSYYILGLVTLLSVLRASLPLNFWRSLLLFSWSFLGFVLSAYYFSPFLQIKVTNRIFPPLIIFIMIASLIFFGTDKWLKKHVTS